MPGSWTAALCAYRYPVNLSEYRHAQNHPGWFWENLAIGDRTETIAFEDRFRARASDHVEAWLEVVYWKLYSQPHRRDVVTRNVHQHWTKEHVTAIDLLDAVNNYVEHPTREHFEAFRGLFGFRSSSIAIAATFPAFVSPLTYPMVDTRVAKWVGASIAAHNAVDHVGPQLIRPPYLNGTATVLTMNDFGAMQRWREWCVHTASKLSNLTATSWRARDVEMAAFFAWGGRHTHRHPEHRLNPLWVP